MPKKDDPERIVKEYRNKIVAGATPNMKTAVEDELTESFNAGEYDRPSTVTLGVGTKVAVFSWIESRRWQSHDKEIKRKERPGRLYTLLEYGIQGEGEHN